MQHVLILTKNILAEQAIVNNLQRLNCETLCSAELVQCLQDSASVSLLNYFQWVILSDSLCNEEMERLLESLKEVPLCSLRIVENYPNEEEQLLWKERGLTDWLAKDAGFENIREKLSELQKEFQLKLATNNRIISFPNEETANLSKDSTTLLKSLSKKEKKVFERLVEGYEKKEILSRKVLCDYLWSDGETPSNMSQLSCLINKLKRKFANNGATGQTITTQWGRGYQLSEEFYDYWIQTSQQEDRINYYSISK